MDAIKKTPKPKTVCVYVTTGSFTMLYSPAGGEVRRMYNIPEREVLTRLAKIVKRGHTSRIHVYGGWDWVQK